jgi:HK97 family phage major capsid protein
MELTKEQLEKIGAVASEAAKKAVGEYESNQNPHMKKLMEDTVAQAEQVKALVDAVKKGEAQVELLNGQLMKFAKAQGQVSIMKDLNGNASDCDVNMAKVFRGIITNNWAGAEKEKDIMVQAREKAIQTGDSASGGYVIPVELSTDIVTLVRERNILAALGVLTVNPMRSRFEIPTMTQGVTANFIGETQEITASDIKFGIISLDPKKLVTMAYASREMIDAADPSIVAIINNDMATAIAEKQMWASLYGNNTAHTPLGLANVPGIQTLESAATGDDPSKKFMRQIRAKVPQKYGSNPSFAFAMNELVAMNIADLISTAAPETSVLLSDDELTRRACGKPYYTSGVIKADKSKSTGANLGDVFYGPWNEFLSATWWGGLRMEATQEGGSAWANDLYGFKAVLPMNSAPRRPDAFCHAKFVKSINS